MNKPQLPPWPYGTMAEWQDAQNHKEFIEENRRRNPFGYESGTSFELPYGKIRTV